MILKVVSSNSYSGKIRLFKVIYDTGTVRNYNSRDVPQTVLRFCRDHKAHVRIRNSVTYMTYLYNEVRDTKRSKA